MGTAITKKMACARSVEKFGMSVFIPKRKNMEKLKQVEIVKGSGFEPKNGDILYGSDFIDKESDKSFSGYYLGNFNHNHWNALQNLGISNVKDMRDVVHYECPFREGKGKVYYWLYPFAISDIPEEIIKERSWIPREKFILGESEIVPEKIDMSFLGHGFTEGTLPYDGSNRIKVFDVKLSDGRTLYCYGYVWYNK
jgi:hypothetical protein